MDSAIIIAYLVSILIPAFAIYLIFLLDLYGTGKGNTVTICLMWGMIGAFGLSFATNTFVMRTFDAEFRTISTQVAPIVEELYKAVILLYFVQQPRFRYFVDGAIYGYATGIGFAITENIFYVSRADDAEVLALAISRSLSASLMHAAAGAVIGIAFGLSRRASSMQKIGLSLFGILFAVIVHFIYNNLLFILTEDLEIPFLLLPVAIGIGLGGGIMIAIFMNWGLKSEKRRFEETLGINVGISSAERKAVQKLGSEEIEDFLEDMEGKFGKEKADLIRRLLVIQANMGILKNNLKSPVGERLKKAWQAEVDELKEEMDDIRKKLGSYIMTLLRSLLPEDEDAVWTDLTEKVADYDPNHVHAFDLFMVASEAAGTIPPEQVERISNQLHKMEIFENVELADLDNLSRAISIKHYSHREMLFDKGDMGDAMYLIEKGHIDIFTLDEHNNEQLLTTYSAGKVVGELALLDGQPRSARVRANGPLKVMILRRKHFDMFIQSRPKVILAFLKFLAHRIRYTTEAAHSEALPEAPVLELHDEDTQPYNIAPEVTDTLAKSDTTAFGVFGRLSAALDQLQEEDKDSPKR